MALQTRRGPYSQFDPAKLAPGEPAAVLSGDPSVPSGKAFYVCYAAGDVKRLIAVEDIAAMVARGEFKGEQGVSIVDGNINAAGNLVITFSDGASVDTGYVVGPQGEQGVSIVTGRVDDSGNLIITLSDGTEHSTGYVVGPQGRQGTQGVSIISAKINEAGHLMVMLSDSNELDTGYVIGPIGPEGKKGDTGQKGDTGTQGIGVLNGVVNETGHLIVTLTDSTVIDTGYVVGPKGADGNVSFDKLTPAQQLSLKGDAATVQIGTVTTLAPGQQATVKNRGTTGDAVFDFAIPKGDKGDTGGLAYATFDVVGGELVMENDPDLSGTDFSMENGELILEVMANA